MKIYCRLTLIVLILVPFSLSGQESLLPASIKNPSFTPFAQRYFDFYSNKSKEYLYSGDLDGLKSNIEVLIDLNIYNDPYMSGTIQNQLGIYEYYSNNLYQSLRCYLNSLRFFDEMSSVAGVNTIMNNIALIFSEINDHESSSKYLRKALEITSEKDLKSRAIYMLNLAEEESNLNNCRMGIRIASELLSLYNPDIVDFSELSIYGVLINCYANLEEDKKAIEWIDKGIESISEDLTYLDILDFYKSAIEYYSLKRDYRKVLDFGKRVYPPPDESFLVDMYETINSMSIAARETGDFDLAISLDKRANQIEFDRSDINKDNFINLLMEEYSFNRSMKEIEFVKREFQENNKRSDIQRKFILNLSIIMVVIIASIIILTRTRKLRKKYHAHLEIENEKLEKINIQVKSNNDELEEENRLLDTLISVFAHDLINPFQAILGFSQLMISDHETLEETDFIEYSGLLSDTSFQLNQLLINLKSLAILQDNSTILEPTRLNVVPIINKILKLFEAQSRNKNIAFNNERCKSSIGFINGDIFESVFRNIISNAVKFSNIDSSIDIECHQDGSSIFITVRDYGIGMPEEVKNKLLNKRYLESRGGTINEKGSGIGLAICIDLLELTGSSLDIISKEKRGTSIILKIPSVNE